MEGNSSWRQKGNIVTINGRDSALQRVEETIGRFKVDRSRSRSRIRIRSHAELRLTVY